jgi:hypothetical protein
MVLYLLTPDKGDCSLVLWRRRRDFQWYLPGVVRDPPA